MKKMADILLWCVFPVCAGLAYALFKENSLYVNWITISLLIYVLFFSAVIHELCHGLAAFISGDHTAKDAGRLTLNPIKHISLIGTIAVPLTLFLVNAQMVFGWAKPVPFNPIHLKKYPRDQVFLALSGPVSNFCLAYVFFNLYCLGAIIFNSLYPASPIHMHMDLFEPMAIPRVPFDAIWFVCLEIFSFGIFLNIILCILNLIPFPPLDGFC